MSDDFIPSVRRTGGHEFVQIRPVFPAEGSYSYLEWTHFRKFTSFYQIYRRKYGHIRHLYIQSNQALAVVRVYAHSDHHALT